MDAIAPLTVRRWTRFHRRSPHSICTEADLRTLVEPAQIIFGGLKGDAHFPAPYGEGTAMELEALINQARGGDVKAFVELTRRFQMPPTARR
jgi:hypothetical protein